MMIPPQTESEAQSTKLKLLWFDTETSNLEEKVWKLWHPSANDTKEDLNVDSEKWSMKIIIFSDMLNITCSLLTAQSYSLTICFALRSWNEIFWWKKGESILQQATYFIRNMLAWIYDQLKNAKWGRNENENIQSLDLQTDLKEPSVIDDDRVKLKSKIVFKTSNYLLHFYPDSVYNGE